MIQYIIVPVNDGLVKRKMRKNGEKNLRVFPAENIPEGVRNAPDTVPKSGQARSVMQTVFFIDLIDGNLLISPRKCL